MDRNAIVVTGAAADVEVFDQPQPSYAQCSCGYIITIKAGLVTNGDSLKALGSNKTATCPKCGKTVNTN